MAQNRWFNPLLAWLLRSASEELSRQIVYLKVENRILRSRLPEVIRVTATERRQLLEAGRRLGGALRDFLSIVHWKTFLRWAREEAGRRRSGGAPIGRPRSPEAIEAAVLRIARETGWGYTRILGELAKLGLGRISRNTVKNILVRNGLDPGPPRHRDSWDAYLRRHLQTLWACDFFSQRVWTISGWVEFQILFFIHLGTRRIEHAAVTCQPSAAWVAQQARNFAMRVGDDHGGGILLRDRDGKLVAQFDGILEAAGVRVKRLPVRSPNLNAFAERWVQSIRNECLDRFLVIGGRHLRYLVSEYVRFYNSVRPHQGIGNVPIDNPIVVPFPPGGDVPPGKLRCETRLGGVLRHYYLDAA